MTFDGVVASALSTCLEFAQSVATRIEKQGATLLETLAGPRPRTAPPLPEPATLGAPDVHGGEARFQLTQPISGPAVRAVGDRERHELPSAYGYDRVVLLPRDPSSAFAYWEITPATRADAVRLLGAHGDQACEVLRVHDLAMQSIAGGETVVSFDIDLPAGVQSWYLKLPRPGGTYFVEIGLRAPGDRFLGLARSGAITPLRTAPSRDDTVCWVTLGDRPAAAGRVGH